MKLTYLQWIGIIFLSCSSSTQSQELQNNTNALPAVSNANPEATDLPQFISHVVSSGDNDLRMYWADSTNTPIKTFNYLKSVVNSNGNNLLFAMNGGMYLQDYSPQGLYIEKGQVIRPINLKKSTYGNFYLSPNGVFFISKKHTFGVCTSTDFIRQKNVYYATQSGPMLLIDGKIHPKFTDGSANVHIRNGVGILPNGDAIFVISTVPVNLYDFAQYFLTKGCKNALYLDGFVSRIYLPSQGIEQMDGHFGVMIGESE